MSFPIPSPKILIADDSDELRHLFAYALKLDGWQIVEAEDGKKALDTIIQDMFDLVILDYRMPEMTGAEVVQTLQKLNIKVPILLISAASEVKRLAEELGLRHYLAKPVGVHDLREKVRKHLEGFYQIQ